MLGERIDAKEALQTGLINKLCLNGSLQKDVDEIAAKLSKIDPFVFEMSKASIMDHNRTTASNDLLFDALATNYSKS
jgi:enoyl-CoA hydratase/carnithine racemase